MLDTNPTPRGRAWICFWTALAFVLLNAPFWWIQHSNFLVRPWFNLELLLPVVLFRRYKIVAILGLCICWTLDLAVSQSATFHFASPLEFIRSAHFLSQSQLPSFVSFDRVLLAVPFLLAALLAVFCLRRLPPRTVPWKTCLVLAVCIAGVDIGNGSSIMSKRSVHLISGNPAGSPTFTLFIRALESRRQVALAKLPGGVSATDVSDIAGWSVQHPDGSAVLMIVESMGWNNDERLRNWLRDRVATATVRQRFDATVVPITFTEATTSAELRELCGLAGSYRNMSAAVGGDCLPAHLAAHGWTTAAYHGFSGNMFDRNAWWAMTGIQKSYFAESLFSPTEHQCGGGFPGLCDANVVGAAMQNAAKPRTFTYILTLNSHLPLASMPIPPDLQSVCDQAHATEEVCLITATIGRALDALRPPLENPAFKPPMVVIVGDHMPPFSDLVSRGQYRQHTVPAFVLRPIDSQAR